MSSPAVAVVVAGTLVAAAVDARTGYLPDAVTRGVALLALLPAAADGVAAAAFAGAAAVGGALLALHLLTNGRGLGLGDVKLGIAIGVGLGAAHGIIALGAAFVLGGAYAVGLLATRRARRGDAVPFGPFLAAGTLSAAFVPAGWPV